MKLEDLIQQYPKLYHMAEDGSWPNIQKFGLLSTSALLTKWEYTGDIRNEIECKLRDKKQPICHSLYGKAIIRDQKAMQLHRLQECIPKDMTVADWCKYINRRVFFWPDYQNLLWFLAAKEYVGKSHTVIVVDTGSLLKQYVDKITVCAINSGSTYPLKGRDRPEPRDRETFKPIQDFQLYRIKELAVDLGVTNIVDFILSVDRYIVRNKDAAPDILEHLWPL
jgi:hypothetical protein